MCPSAGPLDNPEFNVVEYINKLFPTEQVPKAKFTLCQGNKSLSPNVSVIAVGPICYNVRYNAVMSIFSVQKNGVEVKLSLYLLN